MSMNARRPGRDAGTSVTSRWPVRSAVSLPVGQNGHRLDGRLLGYEEARRLIRSGQPRGPGLTFPVVASSYE